MNLSIVALLVTMTSALAVPPTLDWPGGLPARTADERGVLGGNVSGLTMVSQTRLFAVRDGPGALLQLDRSPDGWSVSIGWANGRTLQYVDGRGTPDAEAVATVTGEDAVVYVGAERDNDRPNTSHNTILRYDTSGSGPLRALQQWDLDRVLPSASANSGIEGLTWIPDDVFVSIAFRDATGKTYAPSEYPNHGGGLFVVGHEATASLYFVALRDNGDVALVASMPSGLGALMDVAWHAERRELWAVCDNTCDGRAAVWKPATGAFELAAFVLPPPGMASLNNEGFTLSARCVDGAMLAVWSDDSATGGHVLREASLPCTAITSAAVATTTPPSTTQAVTREPPAERAVDDRGWRAGLAAAAGVVVVVAAGAAVAFRRRWRAKISDGEGADR